MTDLGEVVARAKLVTGVALPLGVLSVALVTVDPLLFVGAMLALGAVFGVTYAYARYVDFDTPREPTSADVDEPNS
jgi:hypothetical protein